jgi:hypothetical protein
MSRDGAYILRDLVGRLSVLRLECPKCGRSGRYRLPKLLDEFGGDHSLIDWREKMIADCPRRVAGRMTDQCGAGMPDLVELFAR